MFSLLNHQTTVLWYYNLKGFLRNLDWHWLYAALQISVVRVDVDNVAYFEVVKKLDIERERLVFGIDSSKIPLASAALVISRP